MILPFTFDPSPDWRTREAVALLTVAFALSLARFASLAGFLHVQL